MKKIIIIATAILAMVGCNKKEVVESPIESIPQEALLTKVYSFEGTENTLQAVFEALKGQIILIDHWASWCPDCIKGIPKLQQVQEKYGDRLTYLFLSVDREEQPWKAAIEKHQLKGLHYWFKQGKTKWSDIPYGDAINLKFIPRYMLLDGSTGKVLFYETEFADDAQLIEAIDQALAAPK